ncbi:hypothetical protein [Thalassobaculum litoreum]|uniref:Uncharacterized protein n=1 Tax=Thalassobaculum litoreum DSM 18839 TaxID=1123362 RepID=A0A8G2BFY9_9PROT|nr:hypothetical protein [Thalassobaculum litoreum]SDF44548.1 hypothetical protein SAMN05660686_01384 [Thalassobaculum litoreum DSM 18839]
MRIVRDLLTVALMAGGLALSAVTLSAPALAQHSHGEHEKGPNGGQIFAVGPYDAEIVVQEEALIVRLIEHGGKDLTEEATGGDLVLLIGGKPTKIALIMENGALVGKLDDHLPDEVDAVIRIKTKDGKVHAGKGELEHEHH